jgi:hypothetical protein
MEHPIVTRKGGRKICVSDDVMEFQEAYKSKQLLMTTYQFFFLDKYFWDLCPGIVPVP